jgi:hypothetical protein
VKHSLTLKEAQRWRVFENKVLGIFGLNKAEVTGEWRKLHKEEPNIGWDWRDM